MKAVVCAPVHIASIWFAAALLMLAPALPLHAQVNSAVTPSSSGATTSAPSGGAAGKSAEIAPAETAKPAAHKAAHPKKKKISFMHKMRDKAVQKVQKLFDSKQGSGSKQDSKQE